MADGAEVKPKDYTQEIAFFEQLQKNAERALRIRQELASRRLDLLEQRNTLPLNQFLKSYTAQFKREEQVITIFRKGVDEGFKVLKRLDSDVNGWFGKYKKQSPEEFREQVRFVTRLFSRFESRVSDYEKRMKKEEKLLESLDAGSSEKVQKATLEKLYKIHLEELYFDLRSMHFEDMLNDSEKLQKKFRSVFTQQHGLYSTYGVALGTTSAPTMTAAIHQDVMFLLIGIVSFIIISATTILHTNAALSARLPKIFDSKNLRELKFSVRNAKQ